MGRRVFIGQDFENTHSNSMVGSHSAAMVAAATTDRAVLERLFGKVVGSDLQIVGGDLQIVGADEANNMAAGNPAVYEQWLPLTPTAGISIAAGASEDVTLTPQRTFRPGDLVLSVAAQVLMLTGATIGGENQFVASGAIPCEIFSATSTAKRLKAQTANRGTDIILTFNNPTAGAVVLRGVWFGNSVLKPT